MKSCDEWKDDLQGRRRKLAAEANAACREWTDRAVKACDKLVDEGQDTCSQWADEGSSQCTSWADQGSSQCSQWGTEATSHCCDWIPCKWACKIVVWLTVSVCLVSIWVSNLVCQVSAWVTKMVCKVSAWVTKMVCKSWHWTTQKMCLLTVASANLAWFTTVGMTWIACRAVQALVMPWVNGIISLLGLCRPDWSVKGVKRLTPKAESELSDAARAYRGGKRLILCCDGGGLRGIITLRALKRLEEHLGARCIDVFDMFSGTSTGAIIAGSLAWGMSVDDLIRLYEEKHNAIFTKTVWGTAAGGIVVGSVAAALLGVVAGPVVGIALGVILGVLTPQLAVPKYNNRPMRCILKSVLGDASLASCRRDVLITAKDTVRSETTYFTAFHSPGSVRGTYRDVRLREAIAASAGSAPTYFASIGRFIDGGVGGYNNTAYVAAVEALRYSGTPTVAGHTDGVGNADPNGPWPLYGIQDPHGAGADQLYQAKHTRVVSFNTGAQANNMKVGQASKIHLALQWLGFLIGEGMQDANEQQSYVARNELDLEEGAIQFQRFEVHFTQPAFDVLRGIDPTLPAGVQGSDFEMDAASHFGLMSQVGAAFGEWLMRLEGSTVRFDLPGMVRLGEPGRVEPAKYHISVYAPEVRQELHDENP